MVGQLNLARVAKIQAKKLKQASAHLVRYRFKIREGSPEPGGVAVQKKPGTQWRQGFVKQMSFKSGVRGRVSDR